MNSRNSQLINSKKRQKKTQGSKDCRPTSCFTINMNTIIQNTTLKTSYTPKDTFPSFNEIEHQYQEYMLNSSAPLSLPLFSYYISADQRINHKKWYQDYSNQMAKARENYSKNKYLISKDGVQVVNYNEMIKRKVNEEINYKNSFIQYATEEIQNSCILMETITLDSQYHEKGDNKFLKVNDKIQRQDRLEFMHYQGLKKIQLFNRTFFKNKVFTKGKLDKYNRASITALEPHKDWTPHLHRCTIINGSYFTEYITTLVNTALNLQLGRTQIVVTNKFLNIAKELYLTVPRIGKKGVIEHFIKDTNIFFQELIVQDNNEIKSIANYLTSYLETKYIIGEEENDTKEEKKNKREKKKTISNYDGWAYYMGHLKDKYEPLEYGKKHQKIRRIAYTQLLVSRVVYKRLMNIDFTNYLKNNNKLESKNMYYHVTKLLKSKELKVYKYHEVFDRSQGFPKYEKHNINFIAIMYKEFYQLLDCKTYSIYEYTDYGKTTLIHEAKQIDLSKDDFIIREYKLRKDGSKIEFDVVV